MGCDIHPIVETRKDGRWAFHKQMTDKLNNYRKGEDGLYLRRSYDTFAILADVRNGHGFAGCDTGDGFVPISKPRGLPLDLSEEVVSSIKGREDELDLEDPHVPWLGDHSQSYLTLEEILNYPHWQATTRKRGVLDLASYFKWKRSGEVWPDGWCGWTSGQGVVVYRESDLRAFLSTLLPDGSGADRTPELEAALLDRAKAQGIHANIQAEWEVPYWECAEHFYKKVIPALQELGDPADVRLVFGFDS